MNVKIPKDKVALAKHLARIKNLDKQESKRKKLEMKKSENKTNSKKTAVYCRVGREEQ